MIKDIKRNQILRETFALDNTQIPADIKIFTHRVNIPFDVISVLDDHMNNLDENCFVYTGDVCCSGYLAYALFYHEFTKSQLPKTQ